MKTDRFNVQDNCIFTVIPYTTLEGKESWQNGIALSVTCHPDTGLDRSKVAAGIAAKLNACHGLDLPADVEPGILADLLEAAREAARDNHFAGRPVPSSLMAVLSKLSPAKLDGVPVSAEFDNTQALREGWAIFDGAIERDDECEHDDVNLPDDDAAIAHVRAMAASGSAYHAEALRRAGLAVSPPHPETREYVRPAKPPKGFTKLASSADLETLKKSVRAYYGGEEKEYRKTATGYSLHAARGQLSTEILETSRGWYFGHFQ